MRRSLALIFLFNLLATFSFAQTDSLMDMLTGGSSSAFPVSATFKATRIINSSSVENLGAGVLDFRISHRFGQINQGAQNFYGLDNATTRLGLDYGITRWLMIGLGHSVLNKEDDGFAKIKLLRQKSGGTPITLSVAGYAGILTIPDPTLPAGDKWYFSNKLHYTSQILIARKFSESISLQLTPTMVHSNIVDSTKFSNNTFAIGVGGRVKINKRIAITGEYFYRLTNTDLLYTGTTSHTYNSFSLGVDIETGGHVFQLMVTNSQGLTERAVVSQTTDSWKNQALHFGFNISRVFTVVKPKEFRGKPKQEKGW